MIETDKLNQDIYNVISRYVKLKKHGSNYIGLCPFHLEKSPSFTVSKAKGIFKCFGCGKSGDAIAFVMEHENKSFIQAVEVISSIENIPFAPVEQRKEREYHKPPPPVQKVSDMVLNYFKNHRGISNNTLLRFKITDNVRWMPKAKTDIPVIEFNYYMYGELVNVKYRGKNKDFMMFPNGMLTFYNIDQAEGEKEVYIVEGEIDVLSLYEAGIYNVIGVPNGTPPVGSTLNLEYIKNCLPQLNAVDTFILFTDNDSVGRWLREGLALTLGVDKCRTVRSHRYGKDANEILLKHGKRVLKDICLTHKPYISDPKYPFYVKRFLLNYFSSALIREHLNKFGFKTLLGTSSNKIKVSSQLFVLAMWMAVPEYSWTCAEDCEIIMSDRECMDLFKPGSLIDGFGDVRTFIDKNLKFPDTWL